MKTLAVAVAALLAGIGSSAYADVIAPGFNTSTVGACDDCYTSAQSLGFAADSFGETYTTAFVSDNGYLTFNSGQGTYTPTGLTALYTGQPIIAPCFADVDTRGTGTVTYGTGTYDGNAAFGVTWNAVGYYPFATDKTNTFQVILVDQSAIGAGDFDIYYNYGSIQWETGGASGGANGLGGVSAAVGYSNGTGVDGTYAQLTGSLVPGSFIDGGPDALDTGTNDGVPGQFEFEVRNGAVTPPPSSSVPEPTSLLLVGTILILVGTLTRRKPAQSC